MLVAHDDEHMPRPPRRFPGGVMAAGIIWLTLGGLAVFGACLVYGILPLALQVGKPERPGGLKPTPVDACGFWLNMAFGAGFFVLGLRTVRGKAKGTAVGSVISLLIGALYLAIGVYALQFLRDPPPVVLVMGFVAVVIGCLCLLPGALGLAGRSRYAAWRAAPPRRAQPLRWRSQNDPDEPSPPGRRAGDWDPEVRDVGGRGEV